jgi:hypothetical protein
LKRRGFQRCKLRKATRPETCGTKRRFFIALHAVCSIFIVPHQPRVFGLIARLAPRWLEPVTDENLRYDPCASCNAYYSLLCDPKEPVPQCKIWYRRRAELYMCSRRPKIASNPQCDSWSIIGGWCLSSAKTQPHNQLECRCRAVPVPSIARNVDVRSKN